MLKQLILCIQNEKMYLHKFAHFCGCLQEHFVLTKFGEELSIDIKQKR